MAPKTANKLPKEFLDAPAKSLVLESMIYHGPQSTDPRMASGIAIARQPLTFRNSKIIYYGPHACENCGATICRMGHEWGGNSFDYPGGPIYPNTEWHAHICDPLEARGYAALKGIPALHPDR